MPQSPLRKLLYAASLFLVLTFAFLAGARFTAERSTSAPYHQSGTQEKFDYLSSQASNRCGLLGRELVESFDDSQRIQGSCCARMDFHRYKEQVEGLKGYSRIPQVPQDPYDISISLSKELLVYQKDIQLTVGQQDVYNDAMKLSHEGGPCCCRCWRWDAFEGQAKYLITTYNFQAPEIAKIWDLEDGCGGTGHEHG